MPSLVFSALHVGLLAASTVSVHALPSFLPLIPGSQNVPGVEAIGHVLPGGGGDRNAFGQDFEAAGKQWNEALCYKDSDEDGQFNGAELGDPCCEWTSTKKLAYTTATAPGDASSKQDPKIWASVKCANGATPETKAMAYNKMTVAPPIKADNETMAPLPATTTTPTPTTKSNAAMATTHTAVAVVATVGVVVGML